MGDAMSTEPTKTLSVPCQGGPMDGQMLEVSAPPPAVISLPVFAGQQMMLAHYNLWTFRGAGVNRYRYEYDAQTPVVTVVDDSDPVWRGVTGSITSTFGAADAPDLPEGARTITITDELAPVADEAEPALESAPPATEEVTEPNPEPAADPDVLPDADAESALPAVTAETVEEAPAPTVSRNPDGTRRINPKAQPATPPRNGTGQRRDARR